MPVITGNDLVRTFQSYEYVPYLWGGWTPGTGWDCSGACNWIIGGIYHLALPGVGPYQFNQNYGHGPVVADWIQWVGVTRGDFPHVSPVPGDLIAWAPNSHMGMAINATRFVSAANPSQGTIEADIDGFFPFAPFVLRLIEVRVGASLPTIPNPPGPGADDYSPRISNTASQIAGAGRLAYHSAAAIKSLRR